MTISPPSNVRLNTDEPARVLATGVDSMVLALYVEWSDSGFFDELAELKRSAKSTGDLTPCIIRPDDGTGPWVATVKPHGANGYEWLLDSGEFGLDIGSWCEVGQRPSVMVSIRSEALWTHGVDGCVGRVLTLIGHVGGNVVKNQISRVDLCADVLLPQSTWTPAIREHFNTRATKEAPYFDRRRLTGFRIGQSAVSARIYDKPREIADKSHKTWMYNVWGLDKVPAGTMIARVEFQLRREAVKSFGLDAYHDLSAFTPHLWATLTGSWLRVVDDVNKHPSRQSVLPWWSVVQSAVPTAQAARHLIRAKAVSFDADQLAKQLLGHLTSLTAVAMQGELIAPGEQLDLASHLSLLLDLVREAGWTDEKFTAEVKKKQAKRMRHGEKFEAARSALTHLGLSSFEASLGRGRHFESAKCSGRRGFTGSPS